MRMAPRSIALALGAVLALATQGVQAFPMFPDPTGMWYDPGQPGWGVSVTQQGETIFVVLFVYDANHNPQWFVASNVVDTGQFVNSLVGEAYAGPLYRANGATFTQPGDMTPLSATSVGTIQIAYVQPVDNLSVTYTVNGTTVNKVLVPQTWGSNAALLAGNYSGGIKISGVSICDPPALLQGVTNFTISQGATPDALAITWGSGIDVGCRMDGTYAQVGQFGTLSGPVSCGPIPNVVTVIGSFAISQMTISQNGFSGFLMYSSPVVNGSSCGVGGSIGGVKN
ncbi:MAG: hypothetical protein WA190_04120 [Usitatibacter sp.]